MAFTFPKSSQRNRIAIIALFLVFFIGAATASEARMLIVDTDKARIRSGPGPDYTTLWMIGEGYPFMQLKQEKEWFNVRDMDGDTGWVHTSTVKPADIVVVSSKIANVHKGPGAKDEVILKCERGVVLQVLDRKNGWIKVKHAAGQVGWVHQSVVWGDNGK